MNYRALQAYLVLGYVPAPDTMFEGIFKLPAGHVLTVGQGTWQVRQYLGPHVPPRMPPPTPTCCAST